MMKWKIIQLVSILNSSLPKRPLASACATYRQLVTKSKGEVQYVQTTSYAYCVVVIPIYTPFSI